MDKIGAMTSRVGKHLATRSPISAHDSAFHRVRSNTLSPRALTTAFIGGGRMGGAMLRACAVQYPENMIHLVDPDTNRLRDFKDLTNVTTYTEPYSALNNMDTIVIAVKPQVAREVTSQIKNLLNPGHVIVSIMAGVSLESLRGMLGHPKIVRAMPNTPSQIGKGVSVFYESPGMSNSDIVMAKRIFEACGRCIQVDTEKSIDIATAISGSGPAYSFYLAEHMCRAARELGLSKEEADSLVYSTLEGSLLLWKHSQVRADELRGQVTSPGGTTEAAITYFDQQKLGFHIRVGIQKAFRRAIEVNTLIRHVDKKEDGKLSFEEFEPYFETIMAQTTRPNELPNKTSSSGGGNYR